MTNVVPEEGYYLSSPLVPDYFVWITIDGEVVPVYSQTTSKGKVTGYIEAKEGKHFAVHRADLRREAPNDSYVLMVYVDGTRCKGDLVEKTSRVITKDPTEPRRFERFAGQSVSQNTERPFLFGKLQLTDDDDEACTDERTIKNLGSIQARYCRIVGGRNFRKNEKSVDLNPKKIHEATKKAQLSHQVTFGAATETKERQNTRVAPDYIDSLDSPYVLFEFKYRSLQLLQIEGHVPAAPTPVSRSSSANPPPPAAQLSRSSSSNLVQRDREPSTSSNTSDTARSARIRAELEVLRRERRIAELEYELENVETAARITPPVELSIFGASKRVKPDEGTVVKDVKKVKREAGTLDPRKLPKGKGKGKTEVLVLSDSD